ncbi:MULTISPECIES: hypothetical protein [Bacillaceae]|nr:MULTISPECIES: hypothetical protein [unclassified Bacillus (in: firmicutes)]
MDIRINELGDFVDFILVLVRSFICSHLTFIRKGILLMNRE